MKKRRKEGRKMGKETSVIMLKKSEIGQKRKRKNTTAEDGREKPVKL